jgi:zinc transport system substrate-binding protein
MMKLLPLWSKICLYRRSPLRDDDCGGDDHDYDHDYDDHDDDHDYDDQDDDHDCDNHHA